MVHSRAGRGQTHRKSRLSQLWQLPLLLLSLALFGYAAYLFIDPSGGLTVEQKIDIARAYIRQDRAEAAIAYLNKLLTKESLTPEQQGQIHLMLAESIELGQKQLRIRVPTNYANIIEQTRRALARGVKADAHVYRRLGEAYEALNKPTEALDNFRKAMALDPDRVLRLQRKVIDLHLVQDQTAAAESAIDEYLASPTLTEAERAWALTTRAQILIDAGRFHDARQLLDEALKLATDPVAQGQVNYGLGYCAYKLRNADEAERYLRVARDQLRTQHPLDGEVCYLLGRIAQDREDPRTAMSFYEIVLVSHIDSKAAPLARLGRGTCRVALGEDDAGLSDLQELVKEITTKPSRQKHREEAVAGLRLASDQLARRGNYQGALEALAHEQTLEPNLPAAFFARLGAVFEQRASQVERTLAALPENERIRRTQQVSEMRTRAGDAYIAFSNKLTLADDKGYGEAMWKGIDLYDQAGAVQGVISALELFVAERPDDPLAPDALLRLGRTYQAAGLFDKAIATFQRNQFRYPQSLAASKSAVPLAQAYIAKGPDAFNKAEQVLLSVVDNNPLLTPEAEEFKQALFELGQLYYRTSRFEEAVARLEEFTERYPKEERLGQLLFLMGDSYRKSASQLDAKLTAITAAAAMNATGAMDAAGALNATAVADVRDGAGVPMDVAEATQARKDRLTRAKALYDRVVEMFRAKQPARDIDRLYVKLSHFYRADCLYDLGDYAEAVKLYDAAAFRYQDDPSALAAYVQIVNSYCALGKMEEAKTANERAKWLLRRIPPESFTDGTFSMPKAYWEQWLKWTGEAGMW